MSAVASWKHKIAQCVMWCHSNSEYRRAIAALFAACMTAMAHRFLYRSSGRGKPEARVSSWAPAASWIMELEPTGHADSMRPLPVAKAWESQSCQTNLRRRKRDCCSVHWLRRDMPAGLLHAPLPDLSSLLSESRRGSHNMDLPERFNP